MTPAKQRSLPAVEPTPPVVGDPAGYALRADARRNRRCVLDAARVRFAMHGLDAQMDDIARDAGVGVGTIYRHFPTKEALLEALAVEKICRITELANEALSADDTWNGLCTFLRRSGEVQAGDRMLSEVLSSRPEHRGDKAAVRDTLYAAVDELIRRGQQAGTIRPDVRGVDVAGLMCGLGLAIGAFDDLSWERYVDIVIAGLRADPGAVESAARSSRSTRRRAS